MCGFACRVGIPHLKNHLRSTIVYRVVFDHFRIIIRKNVTEKQQTRGAFEFEGQQAKKCHSLMTKISTSLLCA